MDSLGRWTCDNCGLSNKVERCKCQACYKISDIIKLNDVSSESITPEPRYIVEDSDIMQVLWKKDCSITYSITSLNINISHYKDILSRGFALNHHNGWIAILTNKYLILFQPTINNRFEIKLVEDIKYININTTKTNKCRIRFINDDIYIFENIQNIIYHYKLMNIDGKYSLQSMQSIKDLSFMFISSNVIDVEFTQTLLLTLSEYHDEIGIYKLHSSNGASWYFDVSFASKELSSNSFHIVSYDGYNDIDDNQHNKTYRNSIYINYGKKLFKFHLSQPNYTLTTIINTEYFGNNHNFCSSKHYGVFWINLDKNTIFQSFGNNKHEKIYRIGEKIAMNMFVLNDDNNDNISDIIKLSKIAFDETYGISGRLLIICVNKNDEYVILQMYINEEAALLYDVCNNNILNPIYQFLYGDIKPIVNKKTVENPQRKKMGTLHCEVTPKFQNVKQLLVDGFIRDCTSKKIIISKDIMTICTLYYDEVKHWKINCNDLNDDKQQETLNEIYTDIFSLDSIEMKCSFLPNTYDDENYASFYLHTFITKDVKRIFIYSNVYCHEVDAHFRHLINAYRTPSECRENRKDKWQRDKFTMSLNCNDFKEINFSYYFEILSIQYMENTGKLTYCKPIFMKRKLKYRWNIDDELLSKLRSAGEGEGIMSDTFDEFNNNWSLSIIPYDTEYDGDDNIKEQNVQLGLNVIRRPINIQYFTIRCLITSSYNNKVFEEIRSLYPSHTYIDLAALCPSKAFSNDINSFWITMSMEIISVEGKTEYMIYDKYAEIFE